MAWPYGWVVIQGSILGLYISNAKFDKKSFISGAASFQITVCSIMLLKLKQVKEPKALHTWQSYSFLWLLWTVFVNSWIPQNALWKLPQQTVLYHRCSHIVYFFTIWWSFFFWLLFREEWFIRNIWNKKTLVWCTCYALSIRVVLISNSYIQHMNYDIITCLNMQSFLSLIVITCV